MLRLGLYDPCQPDAVEIVDHSELPQSRQRLARIMRRFNRLAAKDPDVFLLLGLFHVRPKLRAYILRGQADIKEQRRLEIFVPHHPLERHRTNFQRPPRAE
jgi:hypothetical protein